MGVIEYTFREEVGFGSAGEMYWAGIGDLKLMTVATADDSADSLCCHRILVASPRGVLA